MKSILDKSFRYTPAASTDVRKTIKREQERLKKEREALDHKLISIQRKKA
jgi:hypothetical protein